MKKTLLALATIAAAMALFAGPAGAQYVSANSAFIDDTSVLSGQAVNFSGTCEDADSVSVAIEGGPSLGTIPVSADDTFSGALTIPDLAPGEYTVLLTCGTEVLSTTITVLADGTTGGGGTTGGSMGGSGSGSGGSGTGPALARTGTEVDGLLKVGGGLLVAGAAAVLFATKRRTATV